MTTYENTRCRKCSYLTETEDGELICENSDGKPISQISDEECETNMET